MIRSAFTRYLTVFVCVICAALLITTVIAAMRAEGSFVQTSQEPFLVKDINPTGDSSPSVLTNFDNSLFFAASGGDYGTGLWLSDGTITGTELISGVVLGGWTGTYHDMVQFKERLYLNTGYRIWMSDGTPEGTMPLIPQLTRNIEGMIATSDRLTFFTTDRGCTRICCDNGLEMWVSDGTEQGTLMLADIEAGEGNSNPAGFTYSNERMFFSARGSVHGRELWALDIQLIPRGFLPYIINVGE